MKRILLTVASCLLLSLTACNDSCYNASLINPNGICTTDCPGVCGCDGKFYCNECNANNAGYAVDPSGGCQ